MLGSGQRIYGIFELTLCKPVMNSDTANLGKASNKKVKKTYQVLYLWQGGSWLVGKTTDSNFQL